jgi:hypothetical protein
VRQAAAISSHMSWCNGATIVLMRSGGAKAPRRLKPALQLIAGDCKWKS